MAELDINSSTTTDLKGTVANVSISPSQPDAIGSSDEIVWDFPDASKHLGYYQSIPELKSALHVLAQRVAGLGYETDPRTKIILEHIGGWGEDTFTSIMQMMIIEKKVFGDVFAEIIKGDNKDKTLINLKKLYTGDIRIVLGKNGLIERYEQRSNTPEGKTKKFKPEEILHLSNDRIANEIHGTSIIDALKKIIDAKNQALEDEILIRHRDKALGIVYYDTDDTGKISYANSKIQEAVNKGEMLGLPKDTARIEEFPGKRPADRIQWLQYLDNLFYQIVGTPKVLVTSEGYTEAGGKAGLLAFEPVEIAEKLQLEEDLWNQLAIKVKFKRAPSLLGEAVSNEAANTGQLGIQQNETSVGASRTE